MVTVSQVNTSSETKANSQIPKAVVILNNYIANCSSIHNVTCLNLTQCSLNHIPSQIVQLTGLKILNVSFNEISNISINKIHEAVETLLLSFNRILLNESNLQEINKCFPKLKKLNVCFNHSINEKEIILNLSYFKNLKEFNASGINWQSLKCIKGNNLIEKLIFHSGRMLALPSLQSMNSCGALNFSNNKIRFDRSTVHRIVKNLPNLRYLDISGNINHLNALESRWESREKVDFIKVNNFCEQIKVSIFDGYMNEKTMLNVIDLSNNTTNGYLVVLIESDSSTLQLRRHILKIFQNEILCPETRRNYLKNTVLSCYKYLSHSSIGKLPEINIILCHVIIESDQLKICVAYVGTKVSAKVIDCFDGLEKEELICTQRNNESLSTIPDPMCQEIIISNQSELILLGINLKADEECQLCHIFQNQCLSMADRLKRYSETIECINNGENVMTIVIKLEPGKNLNKYTEFSEKYRSWDFILARNHHLLCPKNRIDEE